MKREKRLTKRERKAAAPPRPAPVRAAQPQGERHVHCVACGRHLEREYFDAPATAIVITCEHKSPFAACAGCVPLARSMLAEHDRTGQPVKPAAVWH